jgi:hypothetical protein
MTLTAGGAVTSIRPSLPRDHSQPRVAERGGWLLLLVTMRRRFLDLAIASGLAGLTCAVSPRYRDTFTDALDAGQALVWPRGWIWACKSQCQRVMFRRREIRSELDST